MDAPFRTPKLQSLWRLLLIPWVFLMGYVLAGASHETYNNAQFITWFDITKQMDFRNQAHLTGSVPYQFIVFVQAKSTYDPQHLRAQIVLTDVHGKYVNQFAGWASGQTLAGEHGEDLATLLGTHVRELVNDQVTDSWNKTKFIRNTPVFEVAKTGDYWVQTHIGEHTPAWRIGLLLNSNASSAWYYRMELLMLYIPFFIGQEIFYLVKLRKWRTWPAYWGSWWKDLLSEFRSKHQD